MSDTYLIDANIFIYAMGRDHPLKAPCAAILRYLGDGSFERNLGPAFVDAEVLQEVFHRYVASKAWRAGVEVVRDILGLNVPVLPVGLEEVAEMIQLAEACADRGVSARDLVHVAVMRRSGIRCVVSADRDFDLCPDVKRVDPMAIPSFD